MFRTTPAEWTLFDSASKQAASTASRLSVIGRERLLRLSSAPSLTPIALDDFNRARDELPAQAKRLVEENSERLETFFDMPRPPVIFYHGPLVCQN